MKEYNYIDNNGNKCLCKLKVDVKANLVYVEDHSDNNGSSIRDSTVQLANQVTEEFGLNKERLIWLESCNGYYMVEYMVYNNKLTGPTRITLSKDEVQEFLN